ncbi:hypothetical protein SAMN03097699_3097 [Flavobacteriaceae bacterium MAR_2010_188]|nr:hypothetical protein SAMN03097699_3097 [Flavobacteriaceae bacterium MAR_2010_188]
MLKKGKIEITIYDNFGMKTNRRCDVYKTNVKVKCERPEAKKGYKTALFIIFYVEN